MGYRSNVAAVFYAVKQEDFPLIKLWLQENFPMETFNDEVRWFSKGMVFECDNVKWYDDYDDVKAFGAAANKFIEVFCTDANDTPQGAYEFMRIGEDYEDIAVEREGDHDWLLECNRSIGTTV